MLCDTLSYKSSKQTYLFPGPPEEYIDLDLNHSTNKNENQYDNCSEKNISIELPQPDITCPYSGLPAAHLNIKNPVKVGSLNRIERKIFFGQAKKLHAGILGKWLLLYTNPVDLKPTSCIHLFGCTVSEYVTESKKREFTFQITIDGHKKFIFQAGSLIERTEWIQVVEECSVRDEDFDLIKTGILSNLRELPTIPTDFYENERKSNRSDINDGIYEEPSAVISGSFKDEFNEADDTYDNVSNCGRTDATPNLPIKLGKQIEKFDYDIPKNNSLVLAEENYEVISNDLQKVDDVKIKISSQLFQIKNEKTLPIEQVDKKCKSNPTTPTNRKHVKSWFFNRISKSSEKTTKPTKANETVVRKKIMKESSIKETENLKPFISSKISAKGGKVNMIISQLEANGHPLFLKNLNDRKVDDRNYEPINTKDNK